MKERPILFSAPMVRAILAGNKTQTRRIIKVRGKYASGEPTVHAEPNGELKVWKPARIDYSGFVECPYGRVGDRLWVKETFRLSVPATDGGTGYVIHRADFNDAPKGLWKPSIFMPRWASRITLEIVSVRVERLQSISEDDAEAEGVTEHPKVNHYRVLWQNINGHGSWTANPWVWVIQFKNITTKQNT